MKRLFLFLFGLLFIHSTYSQIAITEIYYDTPYSEYHDRFAAGPHHLGEFIEIYNYSSEDIPLKGWSLTDRVSRYDFPDDVIIPSEGFLVIVYRDLYYGPNTGDYFPSFFPSTTGKDAQILYQNKIMLRNKRETLNINMGKIRGINYDFGGYTIFSTSWQFPYIEQLDSNFDPNSIDSNENVNYYINSFNLSEDGTFYLGTANPLEANYVPPTQDLEDIATYQQAILDNMAYNTWSYYVELLLNMTCPVAIDVVQQIPSGIYLEESKCFNYDASGNAISAVDCDDPDTEDPEEENEYSNAELDDIAGKIYIYPNPTTGTVNITWEESVIGKIVSIEIANMAGINVTSDIITSTANSASFDISNQPSGVYIVHFNLDTAQFISKNIIKL